MINELLIIQFISSITLLFFNRVINILSLWYLSGIYLISVGLISLLNDFDILVGFLWLIDLGVGLVFFIFILHFSAFLNQKTLLELSSKFNTFSVFFSVILFFMFYLLARPSFSQKGVENAWYFLISWYDYYDLKNLNNNSELYTLREVFFFNNSFEFFLINFLLFFGLMCCIFLIFLIKKIFIISAYPEMVNLKIHLTPSSVFFIRNQNFIKQQNTFAGSGFMFKNKNNFS